MSMIVLGLLISVLFLLGQAYVVVRVFRIGYARGREDADAAARECGEYLARLREMRQAHAGIADLLSTFSKRIHAVETSVADTYGSEEDGTRFLESVQPREEDEDLFHIRHGL